MALLDDRGSGSSAFGAGYGSPGGCFRALPAAVGRHFGLSLVSTVAAFVSLDSGHSIQ